MPETDTKPERVWKLKEDGHLVLEGSRFAIKVINHKFAALCDNYAWDTFMTLGGAKSFCEARQSDYEEMGIG